MVSLLDIAPATGKVSVAGGDVDVIALSAKQLAAILGRFPTLYNLFAGRQPGIEEVIEFAPDAVAVFIAAGTGHLGESNHEEAASRLGIDDQSKLLEAILKITLPGGSGPFVARLKAMGLIQEARRQQAAMPSGKDQDTKSQKPSKD